MKKILFIGIILTLVFFTACVNEKSSDQDISGIQERNDITNKNDLTGNIIQNEQIKEESVKKTFDINIVDLQFEPNSIYVNKGDIVILNFLSEEPIHFSLDAFGVSEYVRTGRIEFVADKSGSFDFVCDDCDSYLERDYFMEEDYSNEENQDDNSNQTINETSRTKRENRVILGVIYVK